MQAPAEAVRELRRAVTELNMPGAMLPAVGLRTPLGDPMYHPVYAEAERLGVMLGVHATVREPATYGAGGFAHWDHHFPESLEEFEERADLSESLRRNILRDSALRLYGEA